MQIILRCGNKTHIQVMMAQLGLESVENRRHRHVCHEMYKCMNELVPSGISNMFIWASQVHPRQTRFAAGNNLIVPDVRLQQSRHISCIVCQHFFQS